METLKILWLLAKFVLSIVELVVIFGLAVGVLEIRQTESFRRARLGWRAGRGRR